MSGEDVGIPGRANRDAVNGTKPDNGDVADRAKVLRAEPVHETVGVIYDSSAMSSDWKQDVQM